MKNIILKLQKFRHYLKEFLSEKKINLNDQIKKKNLEILHLHKNIYKFKMYIFIKHKKLKKHNYYVDNLILIRFLETNSN